MKTQNNDTAARALAIAGLAGIAWIHLVDLGDKFKEVPYIAAGYTMLIVWSGIAALLLAVGTHKERRFGWLAAGAVASSAFIGFTLTRTVGLPNATDDIGNWSEPLGVWSLVVEGNLCGLVLMQLAGDIKSIVTRLAGALRKRNTVPKVWAPPRPEARF